MSWSQYVRLISNGTRPWGPLCAIVRLPRSSVWDGNEMCSQGYSVSPIATLLMSGSFYVPGPGTSEGHRAGGCCWWCGRAGRSHQSAHSVRSEEHTSELQSLMRISYAVFCLKKQKTT